MTNRDPESKHELRNKTSSNPLTAQPRHKFASSFLSALTAEAGALSEAANPPHRLGLGALYPLEIYDHLPDGIAIELVRSWRAGCSSGAETPSQTASSETRRTKAGPTCKRGMAICWVSNVLRSETEQPLENRWLTIPTNVWHRPVMDDIDWAVVSFHTASDTELIEELPLDDEHPDQGSRAAEVYAGRDAR